MIQVVADACNEWNDAMTEKSRLISQSSRIVPYLVVAAAPLCWAGNVVLARGVADLIPPIGLAFWRWTLAFLILLPFAWRHARRDYPAAAASWQILFLLSFFGITCFNAMLYMAVHTTPAINAALIQSAMPAFIILVSLLLFREKATAIQILGTILCMFGAGLVVLRGDLDALMNLSPARGDVLMIIAVIFYAIYSVLLRRKPAIHPLSLLVYIFGIGALLLLPFYLWEHYHTGPVPLTPNALLSIGYVAVFPGLIAYFCWNYGVATIGPNRTGLFINLVPVFAAILAIGWLGETLAVFHVAGMAAIFGGIALFNRRSAMRKDARSDETTQT